MILNIFFNLFIILYIFLWINFIKGCCTGYAPILFIRNCNSISIFLFSKSKIAQFYSLYVFRTLLFSAFDIILTDLLFCSPVNGTGSTTTKVLYEHCEFSLSFHFRLEKLVQQFWTVSNNQFWFCIIVKMLLVKTTIKKSNKALEKQEFVQQAIGLNGPNVLLHVESDLRWGQDTSWIIWDERSVLKLSQVKKQGYIQKE